MPNIIDGKTVAQKFKDELKDGVQVEYWNVEGQKVIKRVMGEK